MLEPGPGSNKCPSGILMLEPRRRRPSPSNSAAWLRAAGLPLLGREATLQRLALAMIPGPPGAFITSPEPPGLERWELWGLWERRAQNREACIAAVKRSGDYLAVARHFARPATPDPRQEEVSKRAWQKSARQWRMDLKALADRGLDARAHDEPLRVPCTLPMYVDLPASADDGVVFAPAPEEPLRVPWPSERERRRSRSPVGANEDRVGRKGGEWERGSEI